jgi:hypothetical protein
MTTHTHQPPNEGYGAAAGFPRDNYPDLWPARTRDDLAHQEWPRLEATVRYQGMWPYIRGHCPDGQLSAEGIFRALRDGLPSANYYRELVVTMRAARGREPTSGAAVGVGAVTVSGLYGADDTTLESAEDGGNGAEEPAAKRARRS